MTEDPKTESETTKPKPLKLAFSLPQIIGGALAAATAAAIGAQLGVAGTVIGAAVASVVGGVAGTIYSAGIDRTHRGVRSAIQRNYGRVSVADVDDAQSVATAEGMPEAPGDQMEVRVAPPAKSGRDWGLIMRRAALSAGAMFVIAAVVVTVAELGLGRALDGSQGTTVGQVGRPAPRTSLPTPTVTVTVAPPSSAAPTPSTEPTHTLAPQPTQSPTPEVVASPLPTATATA